MPATDRAMASTWNTRTRSPASSMARPMVKNTCTCTTSEARPGETKRVMAMNISPNCATPISSP